MFRLAMQLCMTTWVETDGSLGTSLRGRPIDIVPPNWEVPHVPFPDALSIDSRFKLGTPRRTPPKSFSNQFPKS